MQKKELTLKDFQSMGGKARKKKYPKEVLSEWARKGVEAKKKKRLAVDKLLASKKKEV